MNKRLVKNIVKTVLKGKKTFSTVRNKGGKIFHCITACSLAAIVIGGTVWAMGSDERAAKKAEQLAVQQQISLEKDKQLAVIDAESIRERAIQNAQKAKELITLKGEFATLTVDTERTTEIETECESKIGKILSNNVLRVNIPYTIKYMVGLDKITSFVDDNGVLCLIFNPDDFGVVVSTGQYTKVTPNDDEIGWFPKKFSERETLALINSDLKTVAEEYSSDEEKIKMAVDNAKEIVTSITNTLDVTVKFIENTPINQLMFSTEIDETK